MGFINPGRNNNLRIAGVRRRDRPSCPPTKGPRCPSSSLSSSSSSAPKRPPKKRPRPPTHPSTLHHHTTPTPPPQTPLPKLSPFESLPPEILYSVFAHSHNLNLAAASPHLARTLAARSLQLTYVREHRNDASTLTHAFALRFFTWSFLAQWERRFACVLDCTNTRVPARTVSAPWTEEKMKLFPALVARGASLAPDERDAHLAVLHEALVVARGDVARLLVVTAGLKPDVQSLRLAMRHTVGEEGELDVCGMLVGHGADVGDVGVWKEALALGRGRGGAKAVKWLLEGAVPPGEMLGELSSRESGVEFEAGERGCLRKS